MKIFFHFIKAMYAALIAYKRGIYFTARDSDKAFWQLSLHSKYCPGLADFDLKDPENGSMFTHGGSSKSWKPFIEVYDGSTQYEQRFNENFLRDKVLAEMHVLKMELHKEKGFNLLDDYERIAALENDIWKKTEEEMEQREATKSFDPNCTTGRKVLL